MKKVSLSLLVLVLMLSSDLRADKSSRIVALSPHAVELLYAIGAGDQIVATVEFADYPEAAKQIPRIGNFAGVQIEKLVALKPDFVLAWRTGNKSADLTKLESLGIPVHYSHPNNISQVAEELLWLGEQTGRQAAAGELVTQMRKEYAAIKHRYQDKKMVPVFYQLWHDPLQTIGPNNWIDSLINDCRGQNVFNDTDADYPMISLESVLAKNPAVIVIPHHSETTVEADNPWQQWEEIEAVKHGRISRLNGDLLHRFTPRALKGLSALCKAIDNAR